jgi:RNA polymerase sigma-70 factor (ECF subfamily)
VLADQEQYIEAAYEAHHAALVRRLTAITRDAGDAEDLAQDAFVRLAIEVRSDRVPDDAGAWLHRVGWNLAMSRGRHRSVVDRRFGELPRPDAVAPPERMAINRESRAAIQGALGTLSDVERDAVLLTASGYRGVEVADEIGRSAGATRTLLCRARAKLRLRLPIEVLTPT